MTNQRRNVVGIDARAAARPELGGVERWARELARRLPELRPDGYAVLRPPPRLVHRAGHAWEQLVLPVRAARMRALLCPANLAPVASHNAVVVIHDAAALRHPDWYSRTYATWQRAVLPLIARRARRVITVSEFARAELAELLHVDAAVVPGRRRRPLHAGRGPRARPPRAAPRTPVRAHRREPDRAQEPRRAGPRRAGAGRGRRRGRRGGRPSTAVRAGARPGRGAAARPRRRRAAARPVRRRRGVRAAVPLRGLRPAGPGGDGERNAGGRGGDRRRSRRPAGTPPCSWRRRARRSAMPSRSCCETAASAHDCERPGSHARAASPGSGRPARSTR